jgi:fucose permease
MYSLLLAIIYLSFISLGLPDSLLGSAWPILHRELDLPVSYAGIISMLISLCTVVSSLMSDRLTSKYGAGMVTAVSTLISAGSLIGFSVGTEFWMLILFALPYGFGAGAIDSALNNYVALHYKSRHMSWLHCMWGLGASISPYVMSYAITGLNSWSAGYEIVAFIQIGLTVMLFMSVPIWKKRKENIPSSQAQPALSLKSVAKINGAIPCFLTFLCYCGMEATTMLWASSYMVMARGVSPESASSYASLFFIGITVGRGINGFLTLKWDDKTLIRLGQGIIALGVVLIAMPFDFMLSVIGFVVIGLGCAPIYPSIIHMTPALFGEDKSQAMIGVQMACAYTGSMLVPPIFGALANATTFLVMPIFISVFLISMIVLHETVVRKTSK